MASSRAAVNATARFMSSSPSCSLPRAIVRAYDSGMVGSGFLLRNLLWVDCGAALVAGLLVLSLPEDAREPEPRGTGGSNPHLARVHSTPARPARRLTMEDAMTDRLPFVYDEHGGQGEASGRAPARAGSGIPGAAPGRPGGADRGQPGAVGRPRRTTRPPCASPTRGRGRSGVAARRQALAHWHAAVTEFPSLFRAAERARDEGPPTSPPGFIESRLSILEHWLSVDSAPRAQAGAGGRPGARADRRDPALRRRERPRGAPRRLAPDGARRRAAADPRRRGRGPRLRRRRCSRRSRCTPSRSCACWTRRRSARST